MALPMFFHASVVSMNMQCEPNINKIPLTTMFDVRRGQRASTALHEHEGSSKLWMSLAHFFYSKHHATQLGLPIKNTSDHFLPLSAVACEFLQFV